MLLDHNPILLAFHDTALYLFLSLLGVTCNILLKIIKSQKARNNFSMKIWFEKNWAMTLLSIVAATATIFSLYPMDQLNATVALGTGLGIDSIIKSWEAKKSDAPKDDKHLTNVD